MKLSKRTVIISFGLGFLSSVCLLSIWNFVAKRDFSIRDDILNGRLKIKLASKLREDKKASEKLVVLLRERWERTRLVTGMEEDARSSDAAMDVWEEMRNKTYLETLEQLSRFAIDYCDTTAALTAKLMYSKLIPSLGGYGAPTEKDSKRSASADLFRKEIISQHPKTWQATAAMFSLAAVAPGSFKQHYIEKIRRLREYLEKDLVEPKNGDTEFEIYSQWIGLRDGPLKAHMIHAIAVSQTNLGTFRGTRDPYWLSEAKKTYQELVKQYPEYVERDGWVRSRISEIDEMLAASLEKTQKN